MTLLLKQIFSFFHLLNSETGRNSLAAGLACGLILGFAPFLSLQTLILLFLVFFLRIQLGAVFLSAFFFKLIAWAADPVADLLGRGMLEAPSLRPLFVELYDMPLVPLTRFNNSIVMGSMILSFGLVIPAFFVFRALVDRYRATVVARLKKTQLWKTWQATKIYNLYATFQKFHS